MKYNPTDIQAQQDSAKDEILRYFTAERLAEYLVRHYPGGKVKPIGKDKYRIEGAGAGGLEIETKDGRAKWHLHAEGAGGDCFAAFGHFENIAGFPEQIQRGAEHAGIMPGNGQAHKATGSKAPAKEWKLEKTYEYTNAGGTYAKEKRRYDGKRFVWYHRDSDGKSVTGAGDGPPLLYRLPDVLETAAKGGTVWIVEGEKDADTLAENGQTATSGEHGAGPDKWLPEYTEAIRGAHCIIIADADSTGRSYAEQIAAALRGAAASVKVIETPKGKDATEFFEQGGTLAELVSFAENAPEWTPEAEESNIYIPTIDNRPPDLPPFVTLNDERILSAGNMSVFTALPGNGKSALCEAIAAAAITDNADTFGFSVPVGTRVLYIDGERSPQDHWNSADRTRRRAGLNSDSWLPEYVRFALYAMEPKVQNRIDKLYAMIEEHRAELVLIDGLGDFMRDVNDPAEAADLIYSLTATAKKNNLGVIGTIHPNPSGDMNKARGHLGSEAMRRAESVLLLKKNSDGSRTLHTNYALGKNRNAPDTIATSFTWSDEHRMFVSCENPDPGAERKADKAQKLAEALVSVPVASNDLMRAIMEKEGCSEPTAKRRIKNMRDAGLIELNPAMMYVRTGGTDDAGF